MKPPPLLLGAALLFWGWQTELPWVGLTLALLSELSIISKVRWDFSDEDFERIWNLCMLLVLAIALFAFANNDGLSLLGRVALDADQASNRRASLAGARTASNLLRWLPIAFFPFLLAQVYNVRTAIPLATISHIMRRRLRLNAQAGYRLPRPRLFHIGYPYFCMTLLAASFHSAENSSFFWGFTILLAWAMWTLRTQRYPVWVWAAIMVLAGVAGFFGQTGIARTQRYIESFNAQWIARFMRRSDDPFQSRTAIGRLGWIKNSDAIAIRLTPHNASDVPQYLREATYRRYTRQTWFAGPSRDDFTPISEVPPSATNQAYWALVDGKQTFMGITVSCYLDGSENGIPAGVLPLPPGTARLENLPAFGLRMNSAGTIVAQGPGLVIFDAFYGPGKTYDSPPGTSPRRDSPRIGEGGPPDDEFPPSFDRRERFRGRSITNEDLFVSTNEIAAVKAVIAELNLATNTPFGQTLAKIESFFTEKFTYRTWQGPQRNRDRVTPLSNFLLQTRAGHCEYFATATVLILRELGIPARYATGYVVHEPSTDGYVVRYSDAHAWTLVWDSHRQIWLDFDTTPPSWIESEKSKAGALRWLGDAWNRFKFELAKFRYGQSGVRKYLLWIIVPGLVLLLYQIIWRRGRKRHNQNPADADFFSQLPGLDSDFYQLEKQLAKRGLARTEAESMAAWLERALQSPELTVLRPPLEQLLHLHYRYRFDPHGLGKRDREVLRKQTSKCLEQLAGIPLSQPA